jgi:rod shape-determining protein MreD
MTGLTGSRLALAVALIATALAVELAVLARLPLPGATPDLVLLVVVGMGLAWGPAPGAVLGFSAGLALDLVPPADHPVGVWAMVLCLIGYGAGLAQDEAERSAFVPLLVVAVASLVSTLLFAGIGALTGNPRVSWPLVTEIVPTAVLYDVALTPFVVSVVMALARRVDSAPTHR